MPKPAAVWALTGLLLAARPLAQATWDAEVRRKADSLTSARDASKVPEPWKVGVHSGFDDLYNRRTKRPGDDQELSPREVSKARAAVGEAKCSWQAGVPLRALLTPPCSLG